MLANLILRKELWYGSQGSPCLLPSHKCPGSLYQLHWAQDVSLTYGLEMSDSSALITDFNGAIRRSPTGLAPVFHTPALSPSLCLCKPCASCHFFLSLPLRATSSLSQADSWDSPSLEAWLCLYSSHLTTLL